MVLKPLRAALRQRVRAAMSVLYKFKSSNDQKTVHFEGPHIALKELRAAIVKDNRINLTGRDIFLLELSNAQTHEVYGEDSLVARNTAVLVKRVPMQRREAIEWGLYGL